MKTKVTINGVEYSLDLEKAKKLGLIEKADARCKSWDDFCDKYETKRGFYYNDTAEKVLVANYPCAINEQLTENEANAMNAFSKLLKLRRDWIRDWNPNWKNAERKYCITATCNCITITSYYSDHHTFSFPTEEMAKEFLACFRYLFEQCKYLI